MSDSMDQGWLLVVGLGNPGRKYAQNRHNAGFQCVDRLAEAYHMRFDTKRDKAEVALGRVAGRRVVLAKPQTFMNDSGVSVGALARFYQVEPAHVLVIYDDLDLPLGTLRLRPQGSAGGHRGMLSIVQHLGTRDFPRLRVGIGRPPGRLPPKAYVLQDFGEDEWTDVQEVYARAVAAIESFIVDGVKEAMNRFNARPVEESEPESSH
jgi:PTH1 family peptidyl-tRNA hydrolase